MQSQVLLNSGCKAHLKAVQLDVVVQSLVKYVVGPVLLSHIIDGVLVIFNQLLAVHHLVEGLLTKEVEVSGRVDEFASQSDLFGSFQLLKELFLHLTVIVPLHVHDALERD